jgi:hypothetical protein
MPLVLRAVFGGATRPFYLLENVIVDVEKQRMEVRRSGLRARLTCCLCTGPCVCVVVCVVVCVL